MIVTDLLEKPCNKSDNINKIVVSCQQLVSNLLTTCNKPCEHILLAACLQTCEIFTFIVGSCGFPVRNVFILFYYFNCSKRVSKKLP